MKNSHNFCWGEAFLQFLHFKRNDPTLADMRVPVTDNNIVKQIQAYFEIQTRSINRPTAELKRAHKNMYKASQTLMNYGWFAFGSVTDYIEKLLQSWPQLSNYVGWTAHIVTKHVNTCPVLHHRQHLIHTAQIGANEGIHNIADLANAINNNKTLTLQHKCNTCDLELQTSEILIDSLKKILIFDTYNINVQQTGTLNYASGKTTQIIQNYTYYLTAQIVYCHDHFWLLLKDGNNYWKLETKIEPGEQYVAQPITEQAYIKPTCHKHFQDAKPVIQIWMRD